MLLGQGDFIAHLMDVLAPELSKPGSVLHRHNLVGVLDPHRLPAAAKVAWPGGLRPQAPTGWS